MEMSEYAAMSVAEREERIRSLIESFPADQAERDRLKERADEALAQLHRAVCELLEARCPASIDRD
jgi:hypothetical protein